MFFETSDGTRLLHETNGDGGQPTILLIYGLGADHQVRKPQIVRYPSEGLYVIAPDMRGHGNSSQPRTFAPRDCARVLRQLLQTGYIQ
jgi:3-oxoadipate enol-lactonase